jgi:hypothetical protein
MAKSSDEGAMHPRRIRIIGSILVVAIAFAVTRFAMEWLSGGPTSQPLGAVTTNTPISKTGLVVTQASDVGDLPKFMFPGLNWLGIAGLNVGVIAGTPVVPDEPMLQFIAIPTADVHTVAGEVDALDKNRVYRITAWVKSEAGGNFEIEAGDHASTEASYGTVIFDLTDHQFADSNQSTKSGIEPSDDGWQKVWIELPTSTGQLLFNLYVAKGGAIRFTGDGSLGVSLGGFTIEPRG